MTWRMLKTSAGRPLYENIYAAYNREQEVVWYPDILNTNDVRDILDIGKDTMYRLLETGEIKSIRIGRVYKIPKKCLEEYIRRHVEQ